MDKQMTVLEGIIEDVAVALYQKWYNAVPQDQINEEHSKTMEKNARDTTLFVIQLFMDKFNKAAEELQAIDDPEQV
jgi:hypothetical protein